MHATPPWVLPVDIVKDNVSFNEARSLYASYESSGAFGDADGMFWARVDSQTFRLRSLIEDERAWRSVIRGSTTEDGEMATFKNAWGPTVLQPFTELRELCGTLATVFPNTAGVEGDFSTRKSVVQGRDSLLHYRTQSEMRCKAFPVLRSLV